MLVAVMGIWSEGHRFPAESQMLESKSVLEGLWHYERIAGANYRLQLSASERTNALILDYLR